MISVKRVRQITTTGITYKSRRIYSIHKNQNNDNIELQLYTFGHLIKLN